MQESQSIQEQSIQDVEIVQPATNQPQVTSEQIQQYLKMLRKQHNAQCRKKGFKNHIHQPAGHKLVRKLDRQGSLYVRPSTVGQTFLDMQTAKFKASKVVSA